MEWNVIKLQHERKWSRKKKKKNQQRHTQHTQCSKNWHNKCSHLLLIFLALLTFQQNKRNQFRSLPFGKYESLHNQFSSNSIATTKWKQKIEFFFCSYIVYFLIEENFPIWFDRFNWESANLQCLQVSSQFCCQKMLMYHFVSIIT